MKVEVDIEDLEALVFSTAAIKSIEAALQHRLDDPFVKPYLGLTQAHDNLAAAMRNARRATLRTAINWDEPLTKKELEYLIEIDKREFGLVQISAEQRSRDTRIDSLAAKGCLRIGQDVMGTIWAGETRPDIRPIPSYSLAITRRGKEKLDAAINPKTLDLPLIPSGDVVEGVKPA